MWIKFADRLVNFDRACSVEYEVGEMGAIVRVSFPEGGCPIVEPHSTPRAAQDRFDELCKMLTDSPIGVSASRP